MGTSREFVGRQGPLVHDVPSIVQALSHARGEVRVSELVPDDPTALAHALGTVPWPQLLTWGRFARPALRQALANTTANPDEASALLEFWGGGFAPSLPLPVRGSAEATTALLSVAQGPPGTAVKPPLPHIPQEPHKLARLLLAAWGEWDAAALKAVAVAPFRREAKLYFAYDALLSGLVHPEVSMVSRQEIFDSALEYWRERAGHKARRQILNCLRWATAHGYVRRDLPDHLRSHPPLAKKFRR